MNKKVILLKKLFIFLISILGTFLLLEGFFQLNEYFCWLPVPVHLSKASSDFHPNKEWIQKRSNEALEAMKQSPYSDWKSNVGKLPNYDFTKRVKKSSNRSNMFKPNSTSHWILTYPGIKNNVYEATYGFDKWGFRQSKNTTEKKSATTLFLGCSYTFGEGLNDHETFASQYAQLNKNREVINYGTPGYGPNDILYEIQTNSPRALAKLPNVKTVIYTALADHIERTTCSFRYCLQYIDFSPGRVNSPMYRINKDNHIVYKGSFIDHFPWSESWLKHLSKSALLRASNLLSWPITPNDILLTVLVLKEIKKELIQRWKIEQFIVAFYPEEWSAEVAYNFSKVLEQEGIVVLDFSQINAKSENYDLDFNLDRHPSPASAYLYSWLLTESLK